MTEKSVMWTTGGAGDGAAPYSQTDIISWLRRTFTGDNYASQGVVYGDREGLEVAAGGGGGVTVHVGSAYVYGFPYEADADVDVAIPTPGGSNRIDRVVLSADWTARTVRVTRRVGVEGSGVPPALTQGAGVVYDIPLAQVLITPGGAITVTDERVFCHFATRNATENYDDRSVTGAKIATGTAGVNTENIVAGAVTADRMAAGAATLVGEIRMYGGYPAPDGWLRCFGEEFSRTTYAALFAVIGTTFGDGNGVDTFNVPDFRGRFPTSFGSGGALGGNPPMGSMSGTHTISLNQSQMPAHVHQINVYGPSDGPGPVVQYDNGGVIDAGIYLPTESAGSGTSITITNPYTAVCFIIKY